MRHQKPQGHKQEQQEGGSNKINAHLRTYNHPDSHEGSQERKAPLLQAIRATRVTKNPKQCCAQSLEKKHDQPFFVSKEMRPIIAASKEFATESYAICLKPLRRAILTPSST
jgi:hypothetical protein